MKEVDQALERSIATKGLRLLGIGLSLTLLLAFVTIAYSAYEDFTYIFENLGEGAAQLTINGANITLSNFTLMNRGVYPLTIAIGSSIRLDDLDLGSTTTGKITVPPRTQKQISFHLSADLSKAYTDYTLLKRLLFNGSLISFKIDVDVGLQPFISTSFSGRFNNIVGAALDGLTFRLHRIEAINATHLKATVDVEFTNRSPLAIEGMLHTKLLSAHEPSIEYGKDSIDVLAQPRQHYQGLLTFYLPIAAKVNDAYMLEVLLEVAGFTYQWAVVLEV